MPKHKKPARGHKNKYAHLAPSTHLYDESDKTRRHLRVAGKPGTLLPKGSAIPYHGRLYRTESDVLIPKQKRFFGKKIKVYAWCVLDRMLPGEELPGH